MVENSKTTKGFDVEKQTKQVIQWIKEYFQTQGGKGAVIGVSGGKDSTVVGKLLVEALGVDRVFGVLMPNGVQLDIEDSIRVCKLLGINYQVVNIRDAFTNLTDEIEYNTTSITEETRINIAPRLRMTTLYAIGQMLGYRVVGTSNKSESYVGYCTKWGDTAHDFNPIADFTKEEIVTIGDYLGLPYDLIHKVPSDGLSGQSDEEKLGFTYKQIDRVINEGSLSSIEEKEEKLIKSAHLYSRHKFNPIAKYEKF